MFDPDYALFVAIADAGSLSAAARALSLSPASVSKRLARLEARLGARLIHRTTRRIALTPAGHRLHHDLAAISAALAAAEDRASGRGDLPSGPLRLTAPTSFGRMHLAPLLADYAARYPAVSLELDLSDGFTDLMASRYDLALRITARTDPALVHLRLADSRRVLCAAPAYLARHPAPANLDELAAHRLLAADGQLPWLLDGPGGGAAFDGSSAVRTNSSEVVRELALGGAGIALRSLWDVGALLDAGDLLRVLPDWEGSQDVGIYLVHPPAARLPPAARALAGLLTERFGGGNADWESNRAKNPAKLAPAP